MGLAHNFFALLGALIIAAPLVIRLTTELTGFAPPFGINILRYALGLSAFAFFLYLVNRILPSRAPKSRACTPGIVVSTLLWILGASLFSVYLAFAPDYTITYGAFAGVIVTLLFFYLTAAVLIYGAEINAALLATRGAVASQTEET
ncbi:MAG: YhjD/YihY/BrkB family envelope integrity protein [Pseudomonadota bacterium]